MIAIRQHTEPICDIPEHSVVRLSNGELVHFIGVRASEHYGTLPEAHVVNLSDGQHSWLHHSTEASYVCGITDYEARASVS